MGGLRGRKRGFRESTVWLRQGRGQGGIDCAGKEKG